MTIEQIELLDYSNFPHMTEEEFQEYKAGLIAGENERLRVLALKARIQAIQDPHGVLQAAGCSNSNPSLEFNRIIDENDTVKLEEYEAFNSSLISAKAQQIINEQSRKYLRETDWLIIRATETAVACPQNILTLRAAARAAIID